MNEKSVWERLWDYDPNGLLVVDKDNQVQIVNPAFCEMFSLDERAVLGQPAGTILAHLEAFDLARAAGQPVREERYFEKQQIYARLVIFPMQEEQTVACIFVDLTSDYQHREEMMQMKQKLLVNVNRVIDNQMRVVQEITSKLGETTADTKVSLIKIRNLLDEEIR
jgi:PAS domain S-box-containing protein